MIIAIDGPAASGKGTIAKALSEHYGLPYLDTGLLYRAVGHAAGPYEDEPGFETQAIAAAKALKPEDLDGESLLAARTGELASKVAVYSGVRQALYQFQRDFALQAGGAILDGRDIGTVICPEADVKVFIDAEVEVRASRRGQQLVARGAPVDRDDLVAQLNARDARDRSAPHGGFRAAADAHLLDTTQMDIEAAVRAVIGLVDAQIARKDGSKKT